jgi:serine phosphatase RsbU (regulator of sigma subunit)
MGLTLRISTASTHKYASSEGGDSVDIVERAAGGVGIVLADGQGSGAAAKALSLAAVNRAGTMLRDGVRADTTVGAVSDALVAQRGGKVSVAIDVAVIDPGPYDSDLWLARLSTAPAYWRSQSGEWCVAQPTPEPAGRYPRQTPAIHRLALWDGFALVLVSDGITGAGSRNGSRFDPLAWLGGANSSGDLAADLLAAALEADAGRPGDDCSVVALVAEAESAEPRIRSVAVRTFRK